MQPLAGADVHVGKSCDAFSGEQIDRRSMVHGVVPWWIDDAFLAGYGTQ